MPLQKDTTRRIARDAVISLFLYALPVVLMFLFFYISGQRPWEKKGRDTGAPTVLNHPLKKQTP